MKSRPLVCALLVVAITIGFSSVSSAQASKPPPGDFTGTWEGTIRVTPCRSLSIRDSGRCNAVNKITLTILQNDSEITGAYHCSIGTQICRNGNADDSGKITSGSASGNNIRFSVIVSADVSRCLYNGHSPSSGIIRGAYSCYVGGSQIEQGMWEVSRMGG